MQWMDEMTFNFLCLQFAQNINMKLDLSSFQATSQASFLSLCQIWKRKYFQAIGGGCYLQQNHRIRAPSFFWRQIAPYSFLSDATFFTGRAVVIDVCSMYSKQVLLFAFHCVQLHHDGETIKCESEIHSSSLLASLMDASFFLLYYLLLLNDKSK